MAVQKIVDFMEGAAQVAVHAQVRIDPCGVVIADVRAAEEDHAVVNCSDLAVQSIIEMERRSRAEEIHLYAM